MRRIGLLASLTVLVVPLGSTPRPLPLQAPEAATVPLTGIQYGPTGARLASVDPDTLTALRLSEPLGYVSAWVVSPGGTRLAVGTPSPKGVHATTLRFAEPSTLSVTPGGVRLGGFMRAALWTLSGLFAVVATGSASELETIDSTALKVVARRSIGTSVGAVARSSNGLVLLGERANAIAPARVIVVGPTGDVRSLRLARIPAGTAWKRMSGGMIGSTRQPGLAVDAAANKAYVVDPAGLVASVDLLDLSVAYHRLSRPVFERLSAWLTPTAEAKGMNGPIRAARWLGDGLVAVSGEDNTMARRKGGGFVASGKGAGLTVIDTHDWTAQTIDSRADAMTIADGVLLATGVTWRSTSGGATTTGEGVAAYGPDRALLWRFDEGSRRWVLSAYGGRAVVGRASGNVYDVVDVRTGTVLRAKVAGSFPQLLLGAGST
jgi:hypothetical protein